MTTLDILTDKEKLFPQKQENEIRLIISDFAFVGDSGREKNDKTVVLCMSLHWKKFRFERHIDYIEAFPGGDALKATNRIREIFWDYDTDKEIKKIILSLNIDDVLLEKAQSAGADMIITHHPIIFKPINNIISSDYKGRLIMNIIKSDIVVYNAHSNLDICKNDKCWYYSNYHSISTGI